MQQEKAAFKKFLTKLLIGLSVLFVIDQSAGYLLRKLYFAQVSGIYYRQTYSLDSTTAAAIVLGSSRASHHYVPEILEDSLGFNCYNTGRDGIGVFNHYVIFTSILKRYTPKLVILDITPKSLYYSEEDYDRLSALLPYYQSHPEIRPVIDMKGASEKYKLFSATYAFNSQLVSLLSGRFGITRIKEIDKQGYLPLFEKKKSEVANNFLKEPTEALDSNKINALNKIALTCKEKNIQLYFICSPIFSNSANNIANLEIKKIGEKFGVPYWDYSSDSTFDNHSEYFKDNSHLNDVGARKFTRMITEQIVKHNYLRQ